MSDSIRHLPGIFPATVRNSRLQTLLLEAGPRDGEPIVLLHGNCAAATFWEETMLALPGGFRAIAPDLRGYGLSESDALIDATRGFGDWVDDLAALVDQLGLDRFHLVAHSLGGCVAWDFLGKHAGRLLSVALFAAGPPCGFGGVRGVRGDLNWEDGAGSGAGLVNAQFAGFLETGVAGTVDELFSPRGVMQRLFWKPTFHPQREKTLLTAMLQVHLGDRKFPGDWIESPNWPGFAPGSFGPVNAMSPLYNQSTLDTVLAATPKPPLLWVQGTEDAIVSDVSLSDAGYQGQLGLRPDWPGDAVFPAQPVRSQVEYTLDEYQQRGGRVHRLSLADVGHTPYLERPAEVQAALAEHLGGRYSE